MDDIDDLARSVLLEIAADDFLAVAYFCSHISTAPTGEDKNNLPLIYLWYPSGSDENVVVSVNGKIVCQFLEKHLSPSAPEFHNYRDLIMTKLHGIFVKVAVELMQTSQLPAHYTFYPYEQFINDPRSAAFTTPTPKKQKRAPGWLRERMKSR